MDPFVGEIRAFGFNFAPRGWALCQGQLLPITQNTALFALLGTQYGGDGRSTFALPNLQGRVPINAGQGPGLSDYSQGAVLGSPTVTLNNTQLPPHVHSLNADRNNVTTGTPTNNLFGKTANRLGTLYTMVGNTTLMAGGVVENTGGTQAHDNMQPFLVLNYCIALQGIFPQRP